MPSNIALPKEQCLETAEHANSRYLWLQGPPHKRLQHAKCAKSRMNHHQPSVATVSRFANHCGSLCELEMRFGVVD
eukprot:6998020-Alexandrium_andersonii.AAC.1